MTIKEAIRILDPETSKEALLPYAYDSYQRRKVVDEACRIAVDELRKHQWISVKDRLPEETCIAISKYKDYMIGYISEDEYSNTGYVCEDDDGVICFDVTHWQPMLEPPKEGVENAG